MNKITFMPLPCKVCISRENSEKIQKNDAIYRIIFNGLFTAPDIAHAKESWEKALCNESVESAMLTEILFLSKSESYPCHLQTLKEFASRKWKSYGCEMPMH